MTVGTRPLTNAEQAQDGSARAEAILARAGFEAPAAESVLVRSSSGPPGSPAFTAVVRDLVGTLAADAAGGARPGVALSKDGRSELVTFAVTLAIGNSPSAARPQP